jgi:hypothetical protein
VCVLGIFEPLECLRDEFYLVCVREYSWDI